MANVKLSTTELELVTNADFILTKNAIIQKVYALFGSIVEDYKTLIGENGKLNTEVLSISPKISKGENYEGLPWVVLDYPRYFTKDHIFSIRTFFWWGNFCSITLHLKGIYFDKIDLSSLLVKANSNKSSQEEWYLCCNQQNEWQHHFREDNYKPISSFSIEEIQQMPFIKLAKKIPLKEWDGIEGFCKTNFLKIISLIV